MNTPWKVPLFDLSFEKEEEQALLKALKTGWISMGPQTQAFEKSWQNIYHQPSLAVSNGTAALSLALKALDIRPGQEVILPSLTFVADANCIVHEGGIPVFADIESLEYPAISPQDILSKVTSRTAAIIVVHYAGYPAPIQEITEFASQKGIPVIEDCAHSPLVNFNNRLLGTYGAFGCFSFFANKNMTTAEGGMIISKHQKHHEICTLLRSHGMTTLSWDKQKGHSFHYDVIRPGYNFRIDDLRSTLGLVQLKKLPSINQARCKQADYYKSLLTNISGIKVPFSHLDLPSSHYIFPVVFTETNMREKAALALRSKGIQTSLHYPPIHLFQAYRKYRCSLPHTEQFAQHSLSLPLYPSLKACEITLICDIIKSVTGH